MTDTHVLVPHADTVVPHSIMHPLVEKMLGSNPTPESLEKILNLQRKWEEDEAKRAYTSALVELKNALPPFLLRDKTVDFTGNTGKRTHYTHTSLAGAMETVTPLLSQYGFSLTWKPGNNAKGMVTVTAKLTHRQGYSDESTLEAAPETGGNKSGPQAVASTVTLLARYACLGLLGLATADMTEPVAPVEQPTDHVDTARNMRAMADLTKGGKTKAEIEKYVGKPVQQWTAGDLDKLRAWIAPQTTAADAPADTEVITKDQGAVLKKIMEEFQLTPQQFGGILTDALGRAPKSAADVRKSEFEKITKLFEGVRVGAYNLRAGKIEKPDDDIPF